jgi:two-component system OmpR family response regulator
MTADHGSLLVVDDEPFLRARLLDHVWDYDFGGSSTVVSTYVTYLRRKLASDGPDLIHTQRAVGYSLRLPRPEESQAGPDET